MSGKWRMVKFHWFIYLNQLLCELRSFKQQAIPCHLTSACGQCTSTRIKLLLVKSLDFRKQWNLDITRVNLFASYNKVLLHSGIYIVRTSLYNGVLGHIRNDFLYPSNSKIYEKGHGYDETSLQRTNFTSSLALDYIEVLFHIFYCYWGKENRSLYRWLRYIEVCYF